MTTVSAPGKVLLTGGYLVLEQENSGLVAAVSARFYSTVAAMDPAPAPSPAVAIEVCSPQFAERRLYEWRTDERVLVYVGGSPASPYIELPLQYCLQLVAACELPVAPLSINLVADNDFYSQRAALEARGWPITSTSLRRLPAFLRLDDQTGGLIKTGLGSSAALVASLCGAVLLHHRLVSLATAADRLLVHNVAQAAHCMAQGKIGSGFDVSSAVFGTQLYRRFAPQALEPLFAAATPARPPLGVLLETVGVRLAPLSIDPHAVAGRWGGSATSWALPPGLALILADVAVGSKTPGMVASVLAWRAARSPVSVRIWAALAAANEAVAAAIAALTEHAHAAGTAAYEVELARCATTCLADWRREPGACARHLVVLRESFEAVRALLRALSAAAGVPVEPAEQSALIDATLAIPGVVLGGVPGAGGYDALFFLVVGAAAREAVAQAWLEQRLPVCPMLLDADDAGGLAIGPPPSVSKL